eukprot:Hpha_TRINITY_DN16789_c0_g2::TRINITY_DN16789_c0_g2_i1::g.80373::m.80373/K13354/SLC25A17, PMP34; solute carrier family 25 (peroxisomal adenine nucleotide transporter), member 17
MQERSWTQLKADEQEDVKRLLASLHVFRLADVKKGKKGHMTQDMFATILELAKWRDAPEGFVVQREGSAVGEMTCVLEGRLAKYQKGEDNAPDVVEFLHPGDQIGQLHMFAGSDTASSSVVVDTESAVLVTLRQSDLTKILDTDPVLTRVILNNLAVALRDHVRRHHSNRLVRLVEHMGRSRNIVASTEKAGTTSGAVHFLAGAMSGIGSMSIAYPLDVARTLLQKEGRGDIMAGFEILGKLLREQGITSWYKGWSSHTTSHTLQNAVYHSAYAKLVDVMKEKNPRLSDPVRLLLGVAAGCVAATMVTPLTIVTFRMQTTKEQMSMPGMLLKIINEEGLFSLWNGIGPSLVLSLNPCITFYVFDELKSYTLRMKAQRQKEAEPGKLKLSPVETLIVGATAKAIASVITFPLLMAKIRMGLFGKEKYPSLLSTFAIVLKEEGVAGMFKGVGMSLVRSVLAAALEFLLRERCLELAQKIAGGGSAVKKH